MLTTILFVSGFVLLVYGAGWLVDGAASIARRYHIPNVVIGLTIVALGTSAPELAVNLVASYRGTADVALGNILGSNVSNIFLILGVSAMIFPLAVNRNTLWKEVPFALFGALIVGILANTPLSGEGSGAMILRTEGVILSLFFLLFMIYTFRIGREKVVDAATTELKGYSPGRSVILVILGMASLVAGGRWIVQGAVEIAGMLGMTEAVISLTVVALGTSLPELATCVAAAVKRNAGIVIGNVLGSNIFNVFFVLGTSAIVKPLPFNRTLNFDVLVGMVSLLLLWMLLVSSGKKTLKRWHGLFFVLLYAGYICLLLIRG